MIQNSYLQKGDCHARDHYPIQFPKMNYQEKPYYKAQLAHYVGKGDEDDLATTRAKSQDVLQLPMVSSRNHH